MPEVVGHLSSVVDLFRKFRVQRPVRDGRCPMSPRARRGWVVGAAEFLPEVYISNGLGGVKFFK